MPRKSQRSSHKKRWWKQSWKRRFLQTGLVLFGAAGLAGVLLAAYALLIVAPNLPSLDALIDYRPKIPLRVYTADRVLIGEFGEERRDFVPIAEIPPLMKKAVLAIEDDRFYQHGGVDYIGVLRASLANLANSRSQGASTITMQVARTFFLSRKKTYARKIHEVMLAYKIEDSLSKDQILELYMNQIYLGERAYGFGSAAHTYFGKSLQELTVAEAAMLAGLPKAPAVVNPVANPTRAAQRQQLVLKRMRDLGYITPAQHARAVGEKPKVRRNAHRFSTRAEHAAEMVRQYMVAQYKEDAYTQGYTVYTTLYSVDQNAAYRAVRRGVMDYDRRHGYRGPEAFINLPGNAEEREQVIDEALLKYPNSDELQSAVVVAASPKVVRAATLSGETIEISGEGLRFVASALSKQAPAHRRIRPGAVIRVTRDARKRWTVTQLPEVAAAFVALNAQDGSFRAMVGGFDFALNQFDHVTQAWRQPGSSIKPFIYSAALEQGFSPATMINDGPLAINASDSGSQVWSPQNDDGSQDGPMSMRLALKKSKNLVSIRILQAITPEYAHGYLPRFGFDAHRHPLNLTMVLGTGSVTPLQMAGAYAVFANGGYQVMPHLIQKVVDGRGNVIFEARPSTAGDETSRVLDPRNAFIMDTMLRDVVNSGTAFAASQRLGRWDLAGKTGTTNAAIDGWFAGYGSDIVAVAWMGYDKPRSLGSREFGSTVALPIWIDYMREALRGKGASRRQVPGGVVQVDGDWAYAEYASGKAVRSLGIDDGRSFWQRLFGTPPAPKVEEKDKRWFDDLYRG